MRVVFAIMACAVIIGWFEIRPIWRAGSRKDIAAFCSLMLIASTLFALELLQVNLPNPVALIKKFVDPASRTVMSLFE